MKKRIIFFCIQSFLYSVLVGYSWLAMHYDLTGILSSLSFLGSNGGWLVIPPVAGSIGRLAGTDGILYLASGRFFYK